ncbi:hypothetical protein NMY22_g12286 [Coprinellus aureogranulatus]|nr:hypothetical protein NMY22_g12286 [Coprinellus aureogranulatus]
MALGNGGSDTRTERALNTGDRDEGHILRRVLVVDPVLLVRLDVWWQPRGEIKVAEGDRAKGLVGVEDDGAANVIPGEFVNQLVLHPIGRLSLRTAWPVNTDCSVSPALL